MRKISYGVYGTGAAALLTVLALGFPAGPVTADDAEPAAADLSGHNVAFLVGEGFHDAETLMPMAYLINRGAKVVVVGVEPGVVKAYNSDITVRVEKSAADVSAGQFHGVVIPGGRSPALLREHEHVIAFTREAVQAGKVTAAICHGPQVLVRADVVRGKNTTAVGGVRGELEEAGAVFADVPMQRDGNIITSRVPGDIPQFLKAIEQALVEAKG